MKGAGGCLLGCTLLIAAAIAPAAEPSHGPEHSWTFSLYFENDLFAGTDRNYTNGVKLSWISPDLSRFRDSPELPSWSHRLIEWLPFINEPGLQRNIVLSVGQNMYTPEDTRRRVLIADDRPYAGWLYGGVAFHNRNPERLDSMEIQLGMVGPLSFAEHSQRLVHKRRGLPVPKGWGNQLDNEPGINLIYERKWRSLVLRHDSGAGFDLITHLGATLGNVYTYANTGAEVRMGWNLPSDFGASLIRPGSDTNAPAAGSDPRRERRLGVHLFASVNGRAVLRDIFLDGNTFSDSHSVGKRTFVADFAAGVALIAGRFKVSFAKVLRTREFSGQQNDHLFGSVTVSYSY